MFDYHTAYAAADTMANHPLATAYKAPHTGDPVTMLGGFAAEIISIDTNGPYPKARIQYDATGNRETVPLSSLTIRH
jgi:hypothetical protein